MAEKATLARPYAKAAFAHARERDALAHWSAALASVSAAVADERVQPLLGNPRVTAAQLVELLGEAAGLGDAAARGAGGNGGGDPGLRNFLETLAESRRLGLLPHVARMFEEMRAETENFADVEIVSAVALDAAQQQRLSEALRRKFARDVRLHLRVDPALIGGAIVRYGDLVIDGSLDARLRRLTAELTH